MEGIGFSKVPFIFFIMKYFLSLFSFKSEIMTRASESLFPTRFSRLDVPGTKEQEKKNSF